MGLSDELRGFQHPAAQENGGWKSAEPASSILAAQLAPSLSSERGQSHQLSRVTFAQLRQELAGGIYSQLRLDDSVTDVNKLICIVLKAGLEPTLSVDESLCDYSLERQTIDCLDIIQMAVEKAPQVLIEISEPGLLGVDIHAPLFTWIVLRLIDLLGYWNNETIGAKIASTLSSILYPQLRPWLSCQPVSSFLRACTMGLFRLRVAFIKGSN